MTNSGTAADSGKEKSDKEKNETVVCVLGRLRIDQEQVSVGVMAGKETIVQLDKPAKLGSALTVGSWLNDSWATPVDALLVRKPNSQDRIKLADVKIDDVKSHLEKNLNYPPQVVNLLSELLVAPIYITDLYIRHWKEKETDEDYNNAFKFGIAVKFKNEQNKGGLTLFNDIKLEDVALGIISAPKDYKFEAVKLALPDLRVIDFEEVEKEEKEAAAETDGADKETVMKPDGNGAANNPQGGGAANQPDPAPAPSR